MLHASENQTRILARIVREALHHEQFETLADLTADVKARCARLKLLVTDDDLNAAYTLVGSNTSLVQPPSTARQVEPERAPMTTADARALLVEVHRRTGQPVRIKGIRAVTKVHGSELRDLLAAIKVATMKCDLLEHEAATERGLVVLPVAPVASADDAEGDRNDQPAPEDHP